jgi:RNA polymerase sigma-70 factor (ECF subfamily)
VDAASRRQLAADLARLADGDRSAIEPAFAAMRPFVAAYCRRILQDGTDAEDAAHDALLRLFANATRYDADRDPIPWVLAFAVNACRTTKRRSLRRREAPEVDVSMNPAQQDAILERELREAVVATIDALSPMDADALRVAMGERPSDPTFRKRVSRAMARFRLAWRHDD